MPKEFNLDNYRYVEEYITYQQFLEHRPQQNHLNSDAKFGGALFQPAGEELTHILQLPVHNIWTLYEEDDQVKIRNGQQVRGRLGYFHCEVGHNAHATIIVTGVPGFEKI
jgi:hypothetical protein